MRKCGDSMIIIGEDYDNYAHCKVDYSDDNDDITCNAYVELSKYLSENFIIIEL